MLLEADVEPHRAVERGLLIDEQVLQVVAERQQVVFAGEVVLPARPGRDGVDDAADQLLDGTLTLRRADGAAEILGDDDVGGLLGPEAGNLDVALLEDDRALFVADHGGADVPFDLVERIDPFLGEEALVLEPRRADGRRRSGRGVRAAGFNLARSQIRAHSGAIVHLHPSEYVSRLPAPGSDP